MCVVSPESRVAGRVRWLPLSPGERIVASEVERRRLPRPARRPPASRSRRPRSRAESAVLPAIPRCRMRCRCSAHDQPRVRSRLRSHNQPRLRLRSPRCGGEYAPVGLPPAPPPVAPQHRNLADLSSTGRAPRRDLSKHAFTAHGSSPSSRNRSLPPAVRWERAWSSWPRSIARSRW